MSIRNIASSAVALAAAASLIACGGGREQSDAGTNTPDAGTGCVGICNDGGSNNPDGGGNNNPGGDGGYDGGLLAVTLEDLRGPNVPFGANVEVKDVVVHTVSYSKQGDKGDYRADFWVSDPSKPNFGIWVSKFYTDQPGPYLPKSGDKITINGYFGTISKFENPTGYRRQIANKPAGATRLPLTISDPTPVSVPEPISVSADSFGNADGGTARPNMDHAGARIFIEGPVEITNPTPKAFQRESANPEDSTYYGFEISGGILVNNSKTYKADGGCPWQTIALDAGTQGQKVVFQGGLSGVWDTYTFAGCSDGGTDVFGCGEAKASNEGKIPGTDNNYTMVLYPQGCEDFVGGEVVAQ
ncbi:MAG: hypothetical protein WBV82_30220 [Myxococcaceae bacterium]